MDKSAQNIATADLRPGYRFDDPSGIWRLKVQAAVWPGLVVVLRVRAENALQVSPADHEDVVQALPSSGPHPPLREGVCPRRADGRLHHREAFCAEDLIEGAGELGVSIPEQDVLVLEPSGDREVPCLLGDPGRLGPTDRAGA